MLPGWPPFELRPPLLLEELDPELELDELELELEELDEELDEPPVEVEPLFWFLMTISPSRTKNPPPPVELLPAKPPKKPPPPKNPPPPITAGAPPPPKDGSSPIIGTGAGGITGAGVAIWFVTVTTVGEGAQVCRTGRTWRVFR